ncbi:class I SAM-dependent DNA methyltransferase [Streptomyces sp. NPDC059076]|uniref:class I SAM-dependent DNA methyltransferase n=1 Tax=unclassified Streptomyces TaxID=2593676 RepID=UPI0036CB0F3B
MTYDSLVNHGDYLSPHYLAEVLPKDLKAKDGLLTRWAAFEEAERRRHADAAADAARQGLAPDTVPPRVRTPREGLRALHGPYFAGRAALAQDAAALAEPDAPAIEGWRKRYTESHLDTLRALGYTAAHEQTATVHRSERAYAVPVLHAEPGLYAVACGWTTEPDAALDPDDAGRLLDPVETETSAPDILDAKALTDFLFSCDEPPRHILLLVGGVIVLADRLAWPEGRYLSAALDAALHRRDDRHGGELDTLAALFGSDALRVPAEGGTAPLAAFLDRSAKHAVGVSTELREGLRLSVEWIANEVLDRLREPGNGVAPADLDDPARLAKELSRESLRYLYRILFLLYAEASPALGILPSDYPEYERGYGLQRLGDLVLRDLVGERSRRGFHLYESLDLLFEKVEKGHRRYGTEPEDLVAEAAAREATEAENEAAGLLAAGTITQAEYTERVREADRTRRAAARSTGAGLRFEALHSELFTKDAVRLISDDRIENPAYEGGDGEQRRPFLDTRLRNETLHKVLRRLMLTKGRGRERGGFISYAQLGINQLGAVYEGLMSYTGFIAEEELYEVAKGGDPSGGSWMVPASRVQAYDDAVFVKRTNEETGRPERVAHPKGSFVYRLAGRDRQTSASYYTPKSLTEVTVELALRHRLDQDGTTTPAKELLEWKICEPALGSGAFLNEAVDQVAAEYLRRRERELGRRVDPELRQIELQKAKAYIALHNAYGVDLNATAVELAEVSLWLNSMHPGMRAPWFGLHLRRGNSLIGAGRKVYGADALTGGDWLAKKNTLAPKDLPFRDGPLPEGAVHQFLLPAIGWGAVAGEPEAKRLAETEAKALGAWRRGVQKAPKGPKPFQERGDETTEVRQKRYDRWCKAADRTELHRLQGVARRAEFLWSLVATRLELSERAVARRVDVWGADWLEQSAEAEDKQKVLDDLTRHGTPYWRLKTVMDAWCALWFWPLDEVGLLDGTAPEYTAGGGLVDESSLPGLLRAGTGESSAATEPVEPVEPPSGPAPGDQLWRVSGLFDDPDGEQEQLGEDLATAETGGSRPTARKPPARRAPERTTIPLQSFGDWLDFLEGVLGTADMPEQSLLSGLEKLSPDEALELLADVEDRLEGFLGMRPARLLPFRYPWLNTVEDIAGTTEKDIKAEDGHGFFHWELHFAHVFRGPGGGFDLQVGNPPWVRPRWEEDTVLAELEPWFKLTEKPSVALWRERKTAVLEQAGAPQYFLRELASTTALAEWLGSAVAYPVLRGTQPDLYRAFMCRTWANLGPRGMAGLVHPDTHLGGAKEGRIRAAAYPRLRLHAGFVNVGNWAFEASRNTEFGVHIYGAPQQHIGFDNLSRLYGVEPVVASLAHDGEGETPGMKHDGAWDLRPHQARVVRITERTLTGWQSLTGETDSPAREAALLQPVTTAEQGAIKALSAVTSRVGQHDAQITRGFDEANGKKDGFIAWNTSQPESLSELVLQGPHFGIATPFSKQPKVPCRGNHDWLSFDLTAISVDIVPRTNYVRPEACPLKEYEREQDRWLDRSRLNTDWQPSAEEWATRRAVLTSEELRLDEARQQELLHQKLWLLQPYTRFYRLAWRRMIPFNTERSLFASLIPPGPAHLYGVNSMVFQTNRETVLNTGFWCALLLDYVLRITGRADLLASGARTMPYADPSHPLSNPLLLRTLRLNCLTDAYAPLWSELYDMTWPGYEDWVVNWPDLAPLAGGVRKTWEYGTPLRTEYERRAALVEIDALVAVWLGMTADELIAIHKARYAILADRESNMWFDAKGRQLAQDPYAHGHGQTKQHYEHFLAYQKKERPEPPEGYTAPFYKANREAEMREAHEHFSARLQEAIDKGKWTPPTA